MFELRRRVAVNLFKAAVLGGLNVPGYPQTNTILSAIARMDGIDAEPVSRRTWQSWYSSSSIAPKPSKIRELDRLVGVLRRSGAGNPEVLGSDHNSYFYELVFGGLLNFLREAPSGGELRVGLSERAAQYHPITPLHLHIDAIEVAALREGFLGLPAHEVRQVAGRRVLQLLNERWGSECGSVYRKFRPDLSIELARTDKVERGAIKLSSEEFPSRSLEFFLRMGASPDWSIVGSWDDLAAERVYKLLFAIGADQNFLANKDRLRNWAVDSATAGLAVFAVDWGDGYFRLSRKHGSELVYFFAYDAIYFDDESIGRKDWRFQGAMKDCRGKCRGAYLSAFARARAEYREFCRPLGIFIDEVRGWIRAVKEVDSFILIDRGTPSG